MRGQWAGLGCPQFPRGAPFKGELGGESGAGSRGEVEVLGVLGCTGKGTYGCTSARGQRWAPKPCGMWGATVCPSGSRMLWVPTTCGKQWARLDVGLFLSALLASECLGSVGESRNRAFPRLSASEPVEGCRAVSLPKKRRLLLLHTLLLCGSH